MSKLFLPAVAAMLVALVPALAKEPEPRDDKGGGNNGGGGVKVGKVEGAVTAVGAATVTITPRGGAAVTVSVTAATKVERNGRRATLAAFKVGDRGEAEFDAAGVASKVEAAGA